MNAFRSLLVLLLVAAIGILGAQWLGQESVRGIGEVIVRPREIGVRVRGPVRQGSDSAKIDREVDIVEFEGVRIHRHPLPPLRLHRGCGVHEEVGQERSGLDER